MIIGIALMGMLALAGAAESLHQDAQENYDAAANRDRVALTLELSALPKISAADLRQIVCLGSDERDLLAISPIDRPNGRYHVELTAPAVPATQPQPSAGIMRALISLGVIDIAPRIDPNSRNFILLISEFNGARERAITVSFAAGRIILAMDIDDGRRSENIQFVQDPSVLPGQVSPVAGVAEPDMRARLEVQTSGDSAGNQRYEVHSSSFARLRRDHPDDVNRLLRPIASALGQEIEVFAARPQQAYQVLKDDIPPDAAARQAVDRVLHDLDAEDFHERRSARQRLDELGEPAALILLNTDRAKFSPEVAGAVEGFLLPFRTLSDTEATRLAASTDYLLDVLLCDDAVLRRQSAAKLQKRGVAVPPEILSSQTTEARRCELVDALRTKVLPTTNPATAP